MSQQTTEKQLLLSYLPERVLRNKDRYEESETLYQQMLYLTKELLNEGQVKQDLVLRLRVLL
jgi:hypothetical protein